VTLTIRRALGGDAEAIGRLILALSHHVLDDPAAPGAQRFLDSLTPAATAERIASPRFDYFVAQIESQPDAQLCGVIALRDGSHLYHLFVRADLHGQGVARALWARIRERSQADAITVNSSPSAVPAYLRLGFSVVGPAQSQQGLVSVPMRWVRELEAWSD